jgi:hypothetical protein
MDKDIQRIDKKLSGSNDHMIAWIKIREEILLCANADKNPSRRRYWHIDHGPGHWELVRKYSGTLWYYICQKHKEWDTVENIFILSLCSYFHDIAMIVDYDNLIISPPLLGNQVLRYLGKETNGGVRLTRDICETSLGQYILRDLEQYISERVFREWMTKKDLFLGIESQTLEIVCFILRNYKVINKIVVEEKAKIDFNEKSKMVLAMAAVLQFADWAHLDNTRVSNKYVDYAYNKLALMRERRKDIISSNVGEDGGEYFLFPKLFRNIYVFSPELKLLRSATSKNIPIVSFSFKVMLPKGLKKKRTDSAYASLHSQWRAHFLPSRLQHPITIDHLIKYADVQLLYYEPQIEESSESTAMDLPKMPHFIRDYYSASMWFDLSDAAQFVDKDRAMLMPPNKVFEKTIIEWDLLYKNLSLRHKREYVSSSKPGLSRRVLMYLHLMITKGHSALSDMFYKQLHHEMAILLPQKRFVLSDRVYDTVDAIKNLLQDRLFHKYADFDFDDIRLTSVCKGIGEKLYPNSMSKTVFIDYVFSRDVYGVGDKEYIDGVVSRFCENGIIEKDNDMIILSEHSEMAALMILLGLESNEIRNVYALA